MREKTKKRAFRPKNPGEANLSVKGGIKAESKNKEKSPGLGKGMREGCLRNVW